MAMGGAFGALGADLASLNGNPAGIGMYRRGDAGVTTGFASKKAKINVNGQIGNANQLAGSTTNLGIALSYPSGESGLARYDARDYQYAPSQLQRKGRD
jgi:hypothetical protein